MGILSSPLPILYSSKHTNHLPKYSCHSRLHWLKGRSQSLDCTVGSWASDLIWVIENITYALRWGGPGLQPTQVFFCRLQKPGHGMPASFASVHCCGLIVQETEENTAGKLCASFLEKSTQTGGDSSPTSTCSVQRFPDILSLTCLAGHSVWWSASGILTATKALIPINLINIISGKNYLWKQFALKVLRL